MSSMTSQQLLKEDEGDDDEEQGEEFEFDDSADEDKAQEDGKATEERVAPVAASGSASQTFPDSTQPPTASAGPDSDVTKRPASTAGNSFSGLIYCVN